MRRTLGAGRDKGMGGGGFSLMCCRSLTLARPFVLPIFSTHFIISLSTSHPRCCKTCYMQYLEAAVAILTRLNGHLNGADHNGIARQDAMYTHTTL